MLTQYILDMTIRTMFVALDDIKKKVERQRVTSEANKGEFRYTESLHPKKRNGWAGVAKATNGPKATTKS